MEIREQLYQGKAKRVFATDDESLVLVDYGDDATAGNGAKKGTIVGKGAVNNRMTNMLMQQLAAKGVPNHFVRELDDRRTLVRKVQIVPLEVIVRNISAGSLSARLGLEEGAVLARPVIEFCYKDDALSDPMVNDDHILAIGVANAEELAAIRRMALQVNDFLRERMAGAGIELVDFKLEFGRTPDGEVILADEISPDTCRFWDSKTHAHLDKDLFRRDLGGAEEAYQEVLRRLTAQN